MSHNLQFWLRTHYTKTGPGRIDTDKNGISDAWEDSDGDGAFNIQELMIGKNPANPHDVLGIQLRVSLEWDATNEELRCIKEALMIASKYIFDYTDGHAFISKVEIYDNKQNWNQSHVRIYEKVEGYAGASFVGGYWFVKKYGRFTSLKLPWYISNGNLCVLLFDAIVSINYDAVKDDVMYFAGVLGHELAHYVFWQYDEYKYFTGNYDEDGNPIWGDYSDWDLQEDFTNAGLLTVMGIGQAWMIDAETQQELSTYCDYKNLTRILEDSGLIDIVTNITAQYFYWSGIGVTPRSTIFSLREEGEYCIHAFKPNLSDASSWASIIYAMNMPGVFIWDFSGLYFVLRGYVYTGFHESISSYRPLLGPYTMVWWYMWIL